MNSKIFTLTSLFLFFILKINAQSVDIPISNELNFNLLVEDTSGGQEFSLHTEPIYYVLPYNDLFFNLELNFLSEVDNTTFFRFRCDFRSSNLGDPINPAFLGITNPVLIPPVRKKKERSSQFRPDRYTYLGKYPYKVEADHLIRPFIYRVTVELLKYESFLDYIDGNQNYTAGPTATFILYAQNNPTGASESSTTNSLSVIAFPNPSVNSVTFEYANEATANTISKKLPLGVTIFNDKGIEVNKYILTSTSTKTNSVSYNLDTSQLPKGTYYFQLSRGSKTQVKTIIKE